MSANMFGQYFKLISFGESHGPAMGAVVEGCPSDLHFNTQLLSDFLNQRRPGHSEGVSSRKESDEFEILSGVFENKTLGTPIAIVVPNQDQRSKDYESIKNNPRQGHADDVWKEKFNHVDHRGGGRSSGRETVSRVIGGAIARMFIGDQHPECEVETFITQVGSLIRTPEVPKDKELIELLEQAQQEGQSYGATVEIKINNPPPSLGQPVFRKLKSELAGALMSVGAVNGVELGDGFAGVIQEGTQFHTTDHNEQYGGIRGGISTGEPIGLKVSIKPTSSVLDVAQSGRHDPCVALRAAVVLKSMVLMVMADQILARRLDNK